MEVYISEFEDLDLKKQFKNYNNKQNNTTSFNFSD